MSKFKKLNRDEMKNVLGGGSCCWHDAGWTVYQCNLTKADARAVAGDGLLWCCESC